MIEFISKNTVPTRRDIAFDQHDFQADFLKDSDGKVSITSVSLSSVGMHCEGDKPIVIKIGPVKVSVDGETLLKAVKNCLRSY